MIVDLCVGKWLPWSLIVTASLAVTVAILYAGLMTRGAVVRNMLTAFSISILPYLAILSYILDKWVVFRIGAPIAAITTAAAWGIYYIFRKYRSRLWRTFGDSCAMLLIMMAALSAFLHMTVHLGRAAEITMIVKFFIIGVMTIVCFGLDAARARKGKKD